MDVTLRRTACFPVTVDGAEIRSTVSPFAIPVSRHVADDEDHVPLDAECVMFVDLNWGRAADTEHGLFTAIEKGLRERKLA